MSKSSKNIRKRWSFKERKEIWWTLSRKLFGDKFVNINDFALENYIYFLDNVASRDELIAGLLELSPLADDALSVAENLTKQEFLKFKKILIKERRGENTDMPENFRTLILPERFISAALLADEFWVPIGAALVCIMREEEEKEKTY